MAAPIKNGPRFPALGDAAGNAVEVQNAVDFLAGKKSGTRLEEVTLALGAEMLVNAGVVTDLDKALSVLNKEKERVGFDVIQSEPGLVKVSVIGIGMRSHAGVAAQAFSALAGKGINIKAITTSEIKISILIDGAYGELAVRTLHSAYGLDKK